MRNPKGLVCVIEGCQRSRHIRGWCRVHYERWQRNGDPLVLLRSGDRVCSISGCGRQHFGRGWCRLHYGRWLRTGDPLKLIYRNDDAEAYFWANVERTELDECWLWVGYKNRQGYGEFGAAGRSGSAHRFAYELLIGPIPPGLHIDHRCHDPRFCCGGMTCPHRACCNPAHLLPVTPAENKSRTRAVSYWGRKTHCKHGHEFTPENTIIHAGGERACRACRRQHGLEYYYRTKAVLKKASTPSQ